MSWFARDPRLLALAVVLVLALDVPALVRGVRGGLEVLLAITASAAVTRTVILWKSR